MNRVTTNLVVKGTRYYKAGEQLEKGLLKLGAAIRLVNEPENLYDKNAVSVRLRATGAKLGHISRELAPKYASLVNANGIVEVSVAKISKNNGYLNLKIQVVYEQSEDELNEKHDSQLWQSISRLPSEPGVYIIKNLETGRLYVGSSNNLKQRAYSHIDELASGRHPNQPLQIDYRNLGPNKFEEQIDQIATSNDLAALERKCISRLLKEGKSLYNMTEDGQGVPHRPRHGETQETISDRQVRQRAEEEYRRVAAMRGEIHGVYQKKLATLLPGTSFWAYFATLFIATIISLAILIPGANAIILFLFSATLSLILSHLVREHLNAKAKRSAQYQALLREHEDKLAAIDREHRGAREA